MAEPPKYTLIHIGYPKAAWCFMGDWFSQHPAFEFREFAFGGFNNARDICHYAEKNKVSGTRKYFVIRDMRFCATESEEISKYQEDVCLTLKKIFPESKILIVTRGFRSTLKAFYSQYIKKGGTEDFDEFIKQFFRPGNKGNVLDYSYLVNLYNLHFGKENVIPLPFELLKENPSSYIKYLEDKLGIEHFNYEPTMKNISLSEEEMYHYRKFSRMIYNSQFILGPIGKYFYRLYKKKLNKTKNENKNSIYVRTLMKVFKNKKVTIEITNDILNHFRDCGNIFNEYPIYNSFLNLYTF